MADRTMYVGDTWPPLKMQATDETGVLDLSTALSLEMEAVGAGHSFSGPASAIQPPELDADNEHQWNAEYPFAAGDTAAADTFDIFLTVTWAAGEVETFGQGTLEVKDKT